MVARQGGRDRITGRQSPTCAQHQWTGRIEILSESRRLIRASSHPSSHPHSCSGITSILTGRPYCGCCESLHADWPLQFLPTFSIQGCHHSPCTSAVAELSRTSIAAPGRYCRRQQDVVLSLLFSFSLSSFLLPYSRAALPPHPMLSAIPSRP